MLKDKPFSLYEIPVNTPLIDSLSLKIPLSLVTVLDQRLTSQTCVYYESLDAIDEELNPPKPIVITWQGITVRFSLAQVPTWDETKKETIPTDYVVLTLSSKLLKEKYFQGINKKTVIDLYNTFIDFKIFTCTFETFLNGKISDIDICINRYAPTVSVFADICGSLMTQADAKGKHCRLFQDENGVGLSFNNRNWATPSLPFIKLYHKELELNTKSKEFKETFLQGFDLYIKDLTRIEATIKNWKHRKRLERFGILPGFSTLAELLEIQTQDLYKFVTFSLSAYVVKSSRIAAPDLSPTDHLIFELIQNSIQKGYTFNQVLSLVNTFKGSSDKATAVAHSRMRKKLTELFDLAIMKDIKIKAKETHNAHVIEYLKYLKVEV